MSDNKLHFYKVKDESDSLISHKENIFNIPFRIALVGRSGQGKTSVLVNLLGNPEFYGKDFEGDNIFIVSGSLQNDIKLKKLIKLKNIPSENLFSRYVEDEIQKMYDILKEEFFESVEDGEKIKPKIIIFDDVSWTGHLKDRQHGVISEIVCNSRKLYISVIFTSQKYSHLSTVVRNNLNGAIFFNTTNKELELIQMDFDYGSTKKNFIKEFRNAVNKSTHSNFIVNLTNERDKWYLTDDFNTIITIN